MKQMRAKLYRIIPVLVITILVVSGIVVATNGKEVKVYRPPEPSGRLIDREAIKEMIARRAEYKRVIADYIDEEGIELFKLRGCLIKHRLKRSASFECPEDVISKLKAREARIFHIVDLEADKQIKADQVWAEGIDGTGVTVAVLDTGVQADHVELADSIVGCENFVAGEDCNDYNGHGTHVAGIITANGIHQVNSNYATGAAPGAAVYMLKVCNADGACYEDDMMAAMEFAVNNGIAEVMSISIGGGLFTGPDCDSDPLASKVNWVVSQGIVVSVAAGNDPNGVSSPGCASGAVAVGAADKSNYVAYFSGRGPSVDIVAPGVDILSSYSCEAAGDCTSIWYAWMSGTSMATPHIAGVTALLLETDSGLTVSEIKNALYTTATPAAGCIECRFFWRGRCYGQQIVPCTAEDEGAGVVNAYEAYLAVKPVGPECTVDTDCNDGVSCTDDSCVDGTCVYNPDDAYCPADGWIDTGNTRWVSTGQCTEKEQKEEEYRYHYCDATLDCQYSVTNTQWIDTGATRTKADGTTCDDGEFCTVGETCQAGVCTGGSDRDCSALSDQCGVGVCDEVADSCVKEAANEGLACDDGLFCTVDDVCTAGVCDGVAKDCSDAVVCTVDSCDEVNDVCVNTPDNSFCDDGLFCNGQEVCDAQSGCLAGTPVDCNDGKECTIDSCDETNDKCLNEPVADNTPCTGGICCSGTCSVAACSAGIDCNDGDVCTIDSCVDPGACSAYCSNEPITACVSGDGCCPAGCDYTTDTDCPEMPTVLCWSGSNEYLYRNRNQFRKFCKCAMGTYGYNSYSYSWGRKTVYRYVDSGNNENWDVTTRSSYLPVYQVKCTDGNWYDTNQDYYYG